MPAKSRAQQHLMQAAEHGADFPKARKLRETMTPQQLHDFASGPEAGKPERAHPHRMAGTHDGLFMTEHHRMRSRRTG